MLWFKVLIFTLIAPASVAVYIPLLILSYRGIPFWPDITSFTGAGLFFLFVGILIYLSCAVEFARKGEGTPSPTAPPKSLVQSWLYTKTRNPMYVGMLTAVWAGAIVWRSWELGVYAVVVLVLFNAFVHFYEEPHLKKTFGRSYEEYLTSTPRWF
jgi:protein-S-isoprenylcysteine O-methyltransferase Ste14